MANLSGTVWKFNSTITASQSCGLSAPFTSIDVVCGNTVYKDVNTIAFKYYSNYTVYIQKTSTGISLAYLKTTDNAYSSWGVTGGEGWYLNNNGTKTKCTGDVYVFINNNESQGQTVDKFLSELQTNATQKLVNSMYAMKINGIIKRVGIKTK